MCLRGAVNVPKVHWHGNIFEKHDNRNKRDPLAPSEKTCCHRNWARETWYIFVARKLFYYSKPIGCNNRAQIVKKKTDKTSLNVI